MAIAISVAALLVTAGALLISRWQLREARKANSVPAIVDLFREYRSPEMVEARKTLVHRLPEIDYPCPLPDMPDDVARAAIRLTHYLDHLGVLLYNDLVKAEVVSGFVGVSAERIWGELRGCIELERKKRPHGLYLDYFEHLVATLQLVRPEDVRSKLRTVTSSGETGHETS